MLAALETDVDGLICKTESDAFMAKMQEQMMLASASRSGETGQRPDFSEFFTQADANEDGSIDSGELTSLLGQSGLDLEALFDELDSDDDGLISKDEFMTACSGSGRGNRSRPAGGPAERRR
jgi:hypothetical protein